MIGEMDWFTQIVGSVADGEIGSNSRVAKALIRAGLAVVLIEPNGKKAVCTLNAAQAKKANTEAQNTARDAGNQNWDSVRHDCGVYHALTEERELTHKRVKELLAAGANLAVAPGLCSRRIMIVDVDTAEERRAFLSDWTEALNNAGSGDGDQTGALDDLPMTVSSPGVLDTKVGGEEVWVHKDGGHYWFDLPADTEFPERRGKLTWCRCHGVRPPKNGCRNAWVAYWGSGYVLIPPSVRKEGAYRLTGEVLPAPTWLTERIATAGEGSSAESGTGALSTFDDDPIDAWSASVTWDDLLTADGFTSYGHDACGCPTYTRPGSPTHDKSVTAHEVGCSKYDTSRGHAPMHVWSDALGQGTYSKLSYVAKFRHDGDMGSAMRSLELPAMSASDELDDLGSIDDYPKGDAPGNGADDVSADDDQFAPIDWDDLFAEDTTAAEFLPGGLLEKGQQIALIGDGKSGKSLVMIEWCVRAIAGHEFLGVAADEPIRILYLDAENSRRDLAMRLRSIGATPGMLANLVYLSFPPFRPLDESDGARQVMTLVNKHKPNVVILDTVSRFIKGKENDSDTWLQLYRLLHKRLKGAGVAGIRLDHFGKDAEKGGRGSSAKSQDIDHVWELMVNDTQERIVGNATEMVTLLSLNRTHTRTGLGPNRLSIKRVGIKTRDEWLPGETRHTLADVFDGSFDIEPEPVKRPVDIMRHVSELLNGMDSGMPLRRIEEAIRGRVKTRATTIRDAVRFLIDEGFVDKREEGKAHMHYLLKPFTESTA